MSEERERSLHSQAAREIIEEWWRGLEEQRGDRAELRRCHGLAEASLVAAFQRLYGRLERLGAVDRHSGHRLAAAALVLAMVRHDAGGNANLARLMAMPGPNPNKGKVSGLRLRRLLAIDDLEELVQALVRVVRLLDERAPVASLAADIFAWGSPGPREKVRQRWAYEYYANAPDARDDKAA